MTVSISATCQRCLDTVNLSLCARAQLYKLDTNQRTSRRLLSLINKTAIFSTVIVTRSTHVSRAGGRTSRSAFWTGPCPPVPPLAVVLEAAAAEPLSIRSGAVAAAAAAAAATPMMWLCSYDVRVGGMHTHAWVLGPLALGDCH